MYWGMHARMPAHMVGVPKMLGASVPAAHTNSTPAHLYGVFRGDAECTTHSVLGDVKQ